MERMGFCPRRKHLARNARALEIAIRRRAGGHCLGKAKCKPGTSQVIGRCARILFVFSSFFPVVPSAALRLPHQTRA